jgi:hypothetical protein
MLLCKCLYVCLCICKLVFQGFLTLLSQLLKLLLMSKIIFPQRLFCLDNALTRLLELCLFCLLQLPLILLLLNSHLLLVRLLLTLNECLQVLILSTESRDLGLLVSIYSLQFDQALFQPLA